MSVLCQALAHPEPFAISSHTAGHLSGGAPDPGTIPTKVGNCSRLGPGTAPMPAISGSAESWNPGLRSAGQLISDLWAARPGCAFAIGGPHRMRGYSASSQVPQRAAENPTSLKEMSTMVDPSTLSLARMSPNPPDHPETRSQ